jgi:hypothetical protein
VGEGGLRAWDYLSSFAELGGGGHSLHSCFAGERQIARGPLVIQDILAVLGLFGAILELRVTQDTDDVLGYLLDPINLGSPGCLICAGAASGSW